MDDAPLDTSLLQLKAFEGKFDVPEFVGAISERLILKSKADSGPFDPKPFIRTFEAAVDRLLSVRKDVQAKTEQLEKSVRVAEREYSKKMADLGRGFESVSQSFSAMEGKMNDVSTTTIRIGEQLESVHLERQRAQAAYDLIDYYGQFARDDTAKIDALKKEGKAGRRQVAILLRRLNTVAREVDLPSAEKTRENIEKYCEKFEKEMLYLFDRCYQKGDPSMMHHCAQTLLDFNGGSSCVQVYVNQHDFFINRVSESNENDALLWDAIPEPSATPPTNESGLVKLFDEIRATVDQEVRICKAVFPNPPAVMQVFLQRVFAQSIQQYLESLLNRASSISDLAYLRMLHLVHVQTTILVEDLKRHELPALPVRTALDSDSFRRSLSAAQSGATTSTAIATMLENAMEELFVPYTEGQRYIERESRNIGALYSDLLVPFARYHERAHKGKSSMFDRMVDRLGAAAAAEGGTSTTSAQAAAALMRFGGIDRNKSAEEPIREEDGLLSLDLAETMLKWHAEAIGRCIEQSPANDVPKNTFTLSRVLAEALCGAYMEIVIDTVHMRLDGDSKDQGLQHLHVIRSIDLITHLWQQYVNVALLPLASSSVTVRREMVVFNNQTVSRLEGAVNGMLQRITDVVISWLSNQLTKQKKNDFKPRNDDLSFARVNTEPCTACCDMLEKVRDAAKRNLSGKNLEVFFTEIGVSFHSLLLEHLRKFPVNATGGLMLAKDLKSYQDIIDSFDVPALHERFEFLRQLGNVFLVRPEILKSYITEGYLGRIDSALLKPYLALRSDWGQFEKGFDDESDGLLTAEDAAGTESKGISGKLGFGRLSLMMKDLEGLKLGDSISLGMPSGFSTSFTRFSGTHD